MALIAEQVPAGHERTMKFQFLATPKEIRGAGKVQEIVFTKTGTDEEFSIPCGLVITAIGYEAAPLAGIPYERGKVLNIDGRVTENLYVVGWAKRGPSGVIGTNKRDSADVVDLIIEYLKEPKNTAGIEGLLKSGHQIIDQVGWEKINASEVISGELAGKPRIKEADWKRLISLGTT